MVIDLFLETIAMHYVGTNGTGAASRKGQFVYILVGSILKMPA